MGALVIEAVTLKPGAADTPVLVRTTDRLALHHGYNPHIIPLLKHVFAAGPAPDLVHASIEFVIDGAAYSWRADFDINSCELTNRSTKISVAGHDKVAAHLNRILPQDLGARAASFHLPDPVNSGADADSGVAAEPPSSDVLTAEIAQCEAQLQKASQASLTATAMYGELFPLLETLESHALELKNKVTKLERHGEAEEAHSQLHALEDELRKRTEAGRQARDLEKEVAECSARTADMRVIDNASVEKSDELATEIESVRRQFLESDVIKKRTQQGIVSIRPLRWWITGLAGLIAVVVPVAFESAAPFATYVWTAGAALLAAWPWAALRTMRRVSLRRILKESSDCWTQRRSELELSEMKMIQLLRPFAARDAVHLKQLARAQVESLADLEAKRDRLAELRKISKTDDAITIHSAQESALLTELQDRCRQLSPYRLDPVDSAAMGQRVAELEAEARAQQQAASELKEQCESLQSGWSDISVQAEQVSKLKSRLTEWHRWEKAFRALHEMIDQLPEVPSGDYGEESVAAVHLNRISAGRWTRLQYDSSVNEYRIFDQEADLWVRADPHNPTVISSVELACRLSLLDSIPQATRLPLWLVEPFDELPAAMANATAALLADVAQDRQVVMICRRLPAVAWPSGVVPQS